MKDELVRTEEERAVGALDALGPGRVVAGRHEIAAAAPGALVGHVEGKVLGQLGWWRVGQEGLAEPLGLALGDHAAAARGHRHGARTSEQFQLHWGALDAGDAQGNATVVDLVVGVVLEQRVGDLRQAEPLLALDDKRHDRHVVQQHGAHLVGACGRRRHASGCAR